MANNLYFYESSKIMTENKTELWRYSINYGPDGQDNYANVYDDKGAMVGNLKTYHAIIIVNEMNTRATVTPSDKAAAYVKNEYMNQVRKLFEDMLVVYLIGVRFTDSGQKKVETIRAALQQPDYKESDVYMKLPTGGVMTYKNAYIALKMDMERLQQIDNKDLIKAAHDVLKNIKEGDFVSTTRLDVLEKELTKHRNQQTK